MKESTQTHYIMNISYNGRYQLRLKCGHNWKLSSCLRMKKYLCIDPVIINIHYEKSVEHELTFNTFLMLLIVDVSNDLTF